MRSLGSVLFLLLSAAILQASVTATLSSDTVKLGDTATLNIRVEGGESVIPEIEQLCGVKVEQKGSRRSLGELENGVVKATVFTFTFMPESACMIEPIAVEVDGIESYTPPLKLDVSAEASVVVQLRTSKRELYVGEPFELEAVFNRENAPADAVAALVLSDLKGFWVKRSFAPVDTKEGENAVRMYCYLLAPQQAGRLRIDPAELRLAFDEQSVDAWGNPKVERYSESYYSNALELYVNPLPDKVVLVGDFTISLAFSSREVAAKRPLRALITISGFGNFEDISPIEPQISGANVFAGELTRVDDGESMEENWQQELVFVAENNFTVPPIRLSYFDPQQRRVRWVQTQAVPIHVTGAKSIERATGHDSEPIRARKEEAPILFILGTIAVSLLILLSMRWGLKTLQKPSRSIGEDYKDALRLLLAHREEPDVEEMIIKLEASLYTQEGESVDQKALKQLLDRYRK